LRALVLGLLLVLPVGLSRAADRLITLDADDAYLPSVLKILAEKGNLNIITGSGVATERLTIHMKDVPVDQAVNLVVRAAGLAYERIGNSILVADAKILKEETGLSSYVIELKFADAFDVQAAIKDLAGQVQIDRGGNRLIVVTSPRIISEIRGIVAVMDVPARQVMLEARVVEVATDDAKKLGIDWDLLNRQGAIFVEGNYDSLSGSGDGNFSGLKVFPNTPGTHDIFKLNNFSRIAQIYRVAIDLMIRQGNARVLANPKIATLNGRAANMLIGQRIPYQTTGTTFAGGGAAPVQQVEKEEVGIKLSITPLINDDGYITTEIRPEVSTVIGFTGANNDLPIVATRQAATTVRLKDGNTVIIGGLLSEEKVSIVTKVPLLGDVPILGYLFQHHNTTLQKRDLVIEVTPRILAEQQ
jgi:type IV pilus secretin PilQ/predicted competence protein